MGPVKARFARYLRYARGFWASGEGFRGLEKARFARYLWYARGFWASGEGLAGLEKARFARYLRYARGFLEVEPELEESELGFRSPTQKGVKMARSVSRTVSFGPFVGSPP